MAFPLDATVETISYISRLPNETLEKILIEALLSSGFSWPSHFSQTKKCVKGTEKIRESETSEIVYM